MAVRIREILTTKRRRAKTIVRNGGKARMEYPQIQFTSDCIRRYALNRGKRLDEALAEVLQRGGMDIIAALYADGSIKSVGVAARKLEHEFQKQ